MDFFVAKKLVTAVTITGITVPRLPRGCPGHYTQVWDIQIVMTHILGNLNDFEMGR